MGKVNQCGVLYVAFFFFYVCRVSVDCKAPRGVVTIFRLVAWVERSTTFFFLRPCGSLDVRRKARSPIDGLVIWWEGGTLLRGLLCRSRRGGKRK